MARRRVSAFNRRVGALVKRGMAFGAAARKASRERGTRRAGSRRRSRRR